MAKKRSLRCATQGKANIIDFNEEMLCENYKTITTQNIRFDTI